MSYKSRHLKRETVPHWLLSITTFLFLRNWRPQQVIQTVAAVRSLTLWSEVQVFFHCTAQATAVLSWSNNPQNCLQAEAQVVRKTPASLHQSSPNVPRTLLPPSLPMFLKSASLVVLELEVEVAARLEGVKVKRPALSALSSASALLVLRVQGIFARVKLLPHF